jgi:hypothetical protein
MTTAIRSQRPTTVLDLMALIEAIYDPHVQFARDESNRPVWAGMRLPLEPLTKVWSQAGWNPQDLDALLQAAESSKSILRIVDAQPKKGLPANSAPLNQLQMLPDPDFQLPWIDLTCFKAELLPLRPRQPRSHTSLRPLYPGPRRTPPGYFERSTLYQWLRWGKPFQLAGAGGLAAIVIAESQAWKLLDRDVYTRLKPPASQETRRSPLVLPHPDDAVRILDIDLAQMRLTDFIEQWSRQIVPRLVADELEADSLDGVRLVLGEGYNRRVYSVAIAEQLFQEDPILLVHPSLINYSQLLKSASRKSLKSPMVQSSATLAQPQSVIHPSEVKATIAAEGSRPASAIVALKPKGLVR